MHSIVVGSVQDAAKVVADFIAKANFPINSNRICCTKTIQLTADDAEVWAILTKQRDTRTFNGRMMFTTHEERLRRGVLGIYDDWCVRYEAGADAVKRQPFWEEQEVGRARKHTECTHCSGTMCLVLCVRAVDGVRQDASK